MECSTGYSPRWYTRPKTVTHPSCNRARRALTSFIDELRQPLRYAANRIVFVYCTETNLALWLQETNNVYLLTYRRQRTHLPSLSREPVGGLWRMASMTPYLGGAYSYHLPSPPFGQYQSVLPGDRHMWINNLPKLRLLRKSGTGSLSQKANTCIQ